MPLRDDWAVNYPKVCLLILGGYATAFSRFPGQTWIAVALLGLVALTLVSIFVFVVLPAVWSKQRSRRRAAIEVLRVLIR
jgi:hypothetical protein